MPLKRRTRKRKSRKRTTLSKKVAKLSNFVYKTIELKYNDVRYAPQTLSGTSWRVWALTDIDAGVGPLNDERVGDKATISTIDTKVYLNNLTGTDFVRAIVVQYPDKDQGLDTDPQDFLEYGNPANNQPGAWDNMDQIMTPYKAGSQLNFKVLYDVTLSPLNQKQFLINQGGAVNANRLLHIKNKDLKKYHKVLGYQPGQNQSRPQTHGIYLYLYSNSWQLIPESSVHASVMVRMKYRDA